MCLNTWEKRADLLSGAETAKRAGFSSCLWRQGTAWPWGAHSGLLLPDLQQPRLLGSEQTSSPHQPEASQPSLHTVNFFWTHKAEVQHHKDNHYPIFHRRVFGQAEDAHVCLWNLGQAASKLCSNPDWDNKTNIPGRRDGEDKLPEANETFHLNSR